MSGNPSGSRLTYGAELAKRLSDGIANRVPTQHIKETQEKISEACEELLSIGARIRPLMADGHQLGWVRGLHDSERRLLRKWVPDRNDFVLRCLLLSTTLQENEIESISAVEALRLVRLVMAMGERDASLFPYLSAFSTTSISESLWYIGGGYRVSENKQISMPDGKKVTLLCPSDHTRLWASLCIYREQAKKRLDESWNAALLMRAWAGKSVDGLMAELRSATKQMKANAIEPWENVIKASEEKEIDDGWAHLENMETREGMLRELHGMLNNDRHEQLMEKFEKQQIAAAEDRQRKIEEMISRRGGPGIHEEVITFETEEEASKRERELRKGKVTPLPVSRERAERPALDVREKLKKYR